MDILATGYRGEIKDLFTHGTIVLMDSDGNKIYEKGDGKEIAFPRSSAKFIQALVPMSLGADKKFNFTNEEIAIICASHSGEEFHIKAVESILNKIGLDESYLKCGAHFPFDTETKKYMIKNNIEPKNIHNNCSGKHSGMLAAAKILGETLDNYYKNENKVQKKITEMMSTVCGYPKDKINISVDGCGVPVHALPIEVFAYGMARMADCKKLPLNLQEPTKKIIDSVYENSIFTSGTDRIDYHVITKSGEKMIVKSGANGYFAGILPERKQGFAIKCYNSDGIYRNRILIGFLKKIGVILEKDYDYFDDLFENKIYNHRKEIVGMIKENL